MISILLDRRGDASAPPADVQIIDSERAALISLTSAAENPAEFASTLLVRGEALCDWAETAARSRDWKCVIYQSPLEAMLAAFPLLSREDAPSLWQKLGDGAEKLAQPYRAANLLELLHRDFDWHEAPRAQHAARWLLWLDERNESGSLPAAHRVLLEAQAASWRAGAAIWQPLYVTDAAQAASTLSAWLHLEKSEEAESWGVFPLEVPTRWREKADADFRAALVRDGIAAWETLQSKPLPPELLETPAGSAAEYLRHNAAQITPRVLARLETFLPNAQAKQLRALCPPPAPSPLPSGATKIAQWVTRDYLPFRQWQSESGDENARDCALQAARAFGDWFLPWYAGALVGGGASHLAIKHAEALRGSDESCVVFWVIADGLGWRDAQTLAHHLTAHSSRLTLTGAIPVFATIPTLTRFAKPALRWGVTPAEVEAASQSLHAARRETEVAGHRAAINALSGAVAGEIVLWKPLEPDKTYHENADAEIARENVAGALRALAAQIAEAVLALPQGRSLRIVLTTDHGRLLAHSPRTHAIPEGFQASGRAAFSEEAPDDSYDSDGLRRASTRDGGETVRLDPDRYGLSQRCILALDEACFVTNNTHHGGSEAFPHGGIFPEEVLVPWFEFARDASAPRPTARLSGRARLGAASTLQLHLQNTSEMELRFTRFELRVAGREYSHPCEAVLAPFNAQDFSFPIDSWPSNSQWKSARANLIFLQPDEQKIEVAPVVEATSEEMQTRDEDILLGL